MKLSRKVVLPVFVSTEAAIHRICNKIFLKNLSIFMNKGVHWTYWKSKKVLIEWQEEPHDYPV